MADQAQAQLLQRIAAQDRQALAELYDQLGELLFSTALRILGDAHDAEEVIQDVFVQIWEKATTFDAALGSPVHWSLSITRNRSIDRLRARQRRFRLLNELEEANPPGPQLQPTLNQTAFGGDEIAVVRSAVSSLPLEQRQAIEMAFFGGMTHPEIAGTLNQPLGTIKARIRRGMLKLRESLQAHV